MQKFKFNQPLKLINKKPKGEQMTDNGYFFFMYPSLVMQYANKSLKDRERRLYFAISGQAEKDKEGKPCQWAIKHYCQIANIKNNHYAEVLESLCKKGFIIHTNFETLEVLYPISDTEALSSNGKIIQRQFPQNGKSETLIEQKQLSQNQEEKQDQTRNLNSTFGNSYSQIKANNKEINNINNLNKDKELANSPKGEFAKPPQKGNPQTNWADLL